MKIKPVRTDLINQKVFLFFHKLCWKLYTDCAYLIYIAPDLKLWGPRTIKMWRLLPVTTNLCYDNSSVVIFVVLLLTYYNNYAYKLTSSDFREANISVVSTDFIHILWKPWGEFRGLYPVNSVLFYIYEYVQYFRNWIRVHQHMQGDKASKLRRPLRNSQS